MPFSRASSPAGSILVPRRRWPPPILSPSRAASPDPQPAIPPSSAITAPSTSHSPPSSTPSVKRCYRTVCQTTRTAQWNTGPDGLQTLCRRCYNLYYHRRVVLYQGPCGTVSASRKAGWKPVRVTGFPVKHRGATRLTRDLTNPIVTPITGSPQDLELLRENSVAVPPSRRGGPKNGKRGGAVMRGVLRKQEDSIVDGDDGRKRLRRTPPVDLGKMASIVVSSESEGGGEVEEEIEDGEDGEDGEDAIGEIKEGFFVGMKRGGRKRGRPRGSREGRKRRIVPVLERRRNIDRIFSGARDANKGVAGSSLAAPKREDEDVETASVEAAIMVPCTRVMNAKVEGAGMDGVQAKGRKGVAGSAGVGQSSDQEGEEKKVDGMGSHGMITVKVEKDGDLRRLRIDSKWTYEGLCEELVSMFGLEGSFGVRYRDEEGDFVTIASEKDMKELFQLVQEHKLAPLRMKVLV